jgi:hypothetical protein
VVIRVLVAALVAAIVIAFFSSVTLLKAMTRLSRSTSGLGMAAYRIGLNRYMEAAREASRKAKRRQRKGER